MGKRTQECELTNMCMIYDDNGNVLVQKRVKSWCGLAFPGGHVEAHESFVDSTVREIKEETGLDITNLVLCGIKQWYSNGIRKMVFLYKTNVFSGTLISSEEGMNMWMSYDELLKREEEMAVNFKPMLEVFNNPSLSEHYLIIDGDMYHNTFR